MESAQEETRDLAPIEAAGQRIDKLIADAGPILSGHMEGIQKSFQIGQVIDTLREIFLKSPDIRRIVESMANKRLGFLTDRHPATIAKNRQTKKGPQKVYSYEEIVDPLVEGLLRGYRLAGNEINIIAGGFYATKNGTYRKIKEFPGVTNFRYNHEPVKAVGAGAVTCKCWATWRQNGKARMIGLDKDDECIIQARVNAGMGDDSVIGKIRAKLFKRVLERISGQIDAESTDIDSEIPEAEVVGKPTQEPAGNDSQAANGYPVDDRPFDPKVDPIRELYGINKSAQVKIVADELGIPTANRLPVDVHNDILAYMAERDQADQALENPIDGADQDGEPLVDASPDQEEKDESDPPSWPTATGAASDDPDEAGDPAGAHEKALDGLEKHYNPK